MSAPTAAATSSSRPWLAFLAGGAVGLVILVLTQVLSDTRLALGPWALYGNGALAVPFIGFPLAIYAGWTVLGDRHAGRELGIRLASYSLGVVLGAGPFGLFFALPIVLVTGAVYVTWARGAAVRKSDRLLWIALAVSVVLGALPVFGLFGVALLPGSLILLARAKSRGARVALGGLLVAATVVIVFAVPAVFVSPPAAP